MEFIRRSEVAVVPPVEVETEISLQTQPFKQLSFEVNIAQNLIGFTITIHQPQPAHWIDVFLLHPWRLGKAVLAFITVHRCQWIICKRIRLHATKCIVCSNVVVICAVEVKVLTNRQNSLDFFGGIVTQRVTLVVGLFATNHSILVPIINGQV